MWCYNQTKPYEAESCAADRARDEAVNFIVLFKQLNDVCLHTVQYLINRVIRCGFAASVTVKRVIVNDVVSINFSGLEKDSTFKIGVKLFLKLAYSVIYGDTVI